MHIEILKKSIRAYSLYFCCIMAVMTWSACQDKQQKNEDVAPRINKSEAPVRPDRTDEKIILFFGNSLTAGYGLEEGQSFPALVQNRLDSLNLGYKVVNAGLSGETTADGQNRIDWVLKQPMDIFVLELGANDMLRGLDLTQTEKNLKTIVDKVRAKYPDIPVIITGMQAPPNLGSDYTQQFADIFPRLAKTYKAALVPFLLEGVAGDPELNLADRIHPNAEGARILMENVWEILKKYVG